MLNLALTSALAGSVLLVCLARTSPAPGRRGRLAIAILAAACAGLFRRNGLEIGIPYALAVAMPAAAAAVFAIPTHRTWVAAAAAVLFACSSLGMLMFAAGCDR